MRVAQSRVHYSTEFTLHTARPEIPSPELIPEEEEQVVYKTCGLGSQSDAALATGPWKMGLSYA